MVEVKNVSFSYGEEQALFGINLSIEDGSFTAVLGCNGSGKSTLAKHFNALLLPSGGAVYVNGMNTADSSKLFNIRSSAGIVFQNPDNQSVAATIEDEVAFAPENLGVLPKEIRRRVQECLETVNLSDYAKSSAASLSGGQKQRLAIAAVLAMEPEILILDEPTAMLDPEGRVEFLETVTKLNREKNVTVILITHSMEEAIKADRIVVMDSGKVIADGAPREVLKNAEQLLSLGLDVLQVTELAYELKKAGVDIPSDIFTEDEAFNAIFSLIGDKK